MHGIHIQGFLWNRFVNSYSGFYHPKAISVVVKFVQITLIADHLRPNWWCQAIHEKCVPKELFLADFFHKKLPVVWYLCYVHTAERFWMAFRSGPFQERFSPVFTLHHSASNNWTKLWAGFALVVLCNDLIT